MIFWLFFSAFLEDRVFWNCSQKISFSRNHLSCSGQTSSLMVSITRWRKDERHKQQHKPWWEITSEKSHIWDTEHVCAILQNKGKPNKEVKSVSSVWRYFSVPESRCTRGECAQGRFPPQYHSLLRVHGEGSRAPGTRWDGAHTNTSPALDSPGHTTGLGCPQSSDWWGLRAQ